MVKCLLQLSAIDQVWTDSTAKLTFTIFANIF